MSVKVAVKWGKQKFEVEIDPTEPPALFKAQLLALTGVPVERQKIMGLKGGVLKDDADWAAVGLRAGMSLMLVGSAEVIAAPPPPPPSSSEKDKEAASSASKTKEEEEEEGGYHVGLTNLGNTCYMAASLQCLRAAREFDAGVCEYAPGAGDRGDPRAQLGVALRGVYRELRRGQATVAPTAFVAVLRQLFPQFAEQGAHGGFKQQDSEECWTALLSALADKLPGPASPHALFEGRLRTTLRCFEAPEEPADVREATFAKLSCHIDQGVAFMVEGLRKGLAGELDKTSPTLGRTARYAVSSEISALPRYLTVQFVRFFWKEKIGKKAKIVKPVQFPMLFDAADLCEPALKARIAAARSHDRAIEDVNMGLLEPDKLPASAAAAAAAASGGEEENAGLYELVGVVTHMGMWADGGHYLGWRKESDDRWIKFDDEKVSVVNDAEILKLDGRGGAEWHIAYILLYRAKPRPTLTQH